MKIPKDLRDKIIKEFGIKNLTIAACGGVSGGLTIFMLLLLALDARGGNHE